ncbi:MAG: uridine kinase [Anaerolineales bacterium]|nr:uridine kinase [Anaerolineales bacterium]MCB9126918.1 uridine kinase [Ardenticatenales bacterium]
MSDGKPVVIGVAGGTGSGKTTVSRAIRQRVGEERIAYLMHDSYYHDHSHLPAEARARVNYDHPASLESARLVHDIQQLKAGHAIEVPLYDFARHARLPESQRIQPRPVILVEGILIFAEAALRDLCDMKLFVDTEGDIRFIRRLLRDVKERGRTLDSVVEQWLRTVKPMHLEFVEPSKRYADIIIPYSGDHNHVALDMIVARIEAMQRIGTATPGR